MSQFFTSAIVCPWLDFDLPPFLQVLWSHLGEIEPFSVTLTQDGLAECDQPRKSPFEIPPPRPRIEPRPQGGQTVGYIRSSTELS